MKRIAVIVGVAREFEYAVAAFENGRTPDRVDRVRQVIYHEDREYRLVDRVEAVMGIKWERVLRWGTWYNRGDLARVEEELSVRVVREKRGYHVNPKPVRVIVDDEWVGIQGTPLDDEEI